MAIYSNLTPVTSVKHGIFESTLMRATLDGPIYDAIVKDGTAANSNYIDTDNGTPIKIGAFTGDGLQTRYATIAGVTDKIAVIGTPAVIKTAFTKAQSSILNFYNKAGEPVKAYAVYDDFEGEEIFAVGLHQFTKASKAAAVVGAYVVTDGNGAWVAQAAAPDAGDYGFIGQIHSIAADTLENVTVVRIAVIQNVQL